MKQQITLLGTVRDVRQGFMPTQLELTTNTIPGKLT
jgi:hypothetical protein